VSRGKIYRMFSGKGRLPLTYFGAPLIYGRNPGEDRVSEFGMEWNDACSPSMAQARVEGVALALHSYSLKTFHVG